MCSRPLHCLENPRTVGLWHLLCGVICWAVLNVTAGPLRAAPDQAVLRAQQRRIAVIERAAPSVVAIFARGGAGGGSGVVISPDGYALTNFHVVNAAGVFMKCGLNDGRLYDAVIVGIDPTGDVALIKLLGRDDFPAAPLGDSDQLQVGDDVFAMGNPFLLATDFHPTVTFGIVSGTHRYQYPAGTFLEYTDCIQVDASINPGNSGGPLFNDRGEVVGINGRISVERRGRVNVGAGYAISINQIKYFMDHLRSGRIVDHATLGATVRTRHDGAVVVDQILEQSEAWRRGLREDDEIVAFAGRPIRSVNQFKNILGIYPKGWKLPLVYRRDGVKTEILVRLRGLHRQSELMPRPRNAPRRPNEKKPREGERPRPDPRARKPVIPEDLPQEYRKLYVRKAGFANYYFNELNQKRLLETLRVFGETQSKQGTWRIQGASADGKPFDLTIAKDGVGLEWGGEVFLQRLDGGELLDEPPGTGGLLIALEFFKRLLTTGRDGFTDCYYLGSEPLDGKGAQVDVLITERSGVQARWYFRKEDGRLVGFDTELVDDADPCEIRFSDDLKSFGDVRLPARWTVRHGEKLFAEFLPSAFAARN
ncbi:MAG: PDZ domain-containing protein [Planctomycetota bacterium]|nr:MAG: PDZ domain-containing protein [Planctomycetota bacterium]